MNMKLIGIVMFVELNMDHKAGLFIALNAIMIYVVVVQILVAEKLHNNM